VTDNVKLDLRAEREPRHERSRHQLEHSTALFAPWHVLVFTSLPRSEPKTAFQELVTERADYCPRSCKSHSENGTWCSDAECGNFAACQTEFFKLQANKRPPGMVMVESRSQKRTSNPNPSHVDLASPCNTLPDLPIMTTQLRLGSSFEEVTSALGLDPTNADDVRIYHLMLVPRSPFPLYPCYPALLTQIASTK
jgi:hypothetical protein